MLLLFLKTLFFSSLFIVELLEELVKGSECAYSLCGLLIGSRGPVPPGSGGMFLCLLLGLEELPFAGFVSHTPHQIEATIIQTVIVLHGDMPSK